MKEALSLEQLDAKVVLKCTSALFATAIFASASSLLLHVERSVRAGVRAASSSLMSASRSGRWAAVRRVDRALSEYDLVVARDLFQPARPGSSAPAPTTDAPPLAVAARLLGTVAGEEPGWGVATIELHGRVHTVAVGDTLGPDLEVVAVYPAVVLLDRLGTLESLHFADRPKPGGRSVPSRPPEHAPGLPTVAPQPAAPRSVVPRSVARPSVAPGPAGPRPVAPESAAAARSVPSVMRLGRSTLPVDVIEPPAQERPELDDASVE